MDKDKESLIQQEFDEEYIEKLKQQLGLIQQNKQPYVLCDRESLDDILDMLNTSALVVEGNTCEIQFISGGSVVWTKGK